MEKREYKGSSCSFMPDLPEDRTETPELDCYHNGDNDQPTTCPICGSRTEFIDVTNSQQIHECLCCGYKFYKYFDEE